LPIYASEWWLEKTNQSDKNDVDIAKDKMATAETKGKVHNSQKPNILHGFPIILVLVGFSI
jgi:hypothetical protein